MISSRGLLKRLYQVRKDEQNSEEFDRDLGIMICAGYHRGKADATHEVIQLIEDKKLIPNRGYQRRNSALIGRRLGRARRLLRAFEKADSPDFCIKAAQGEIEVYQGVLRLLRGSYS